MKKTKPELEAEPDPEIKFSDEKPYDPAEQMPYKLEHFPIYNKYARKNKIPVKVPGEEFYPKMKVRFQRFEQPTNVLKCRIRNKDID
jgi:hypothetical protein